MKKLLTGVGAAVLLAALPRGRSISAYTPTATVVVDEENTQEQKKE